MRMLACERCHVQIAACRKHSSIRLQPLAGMQIRLQHPFVVEHVAHRLRNDHVHLLRQINLLDLPGDHVYFVAQSVGGHHLLGVLRHITGLHRIDEPSSCLHREEGEYPGAGAHVQHDLVLEVGQVAVDRLLIRARPHKVLHHVLLLTQIPIELEILIGRGLLGALREDGHGPSAFDDYVDEAAEALDFRLGGEQEAQVVVGQTYYLAHRTHPGAVRLRLERELEPPQFRIVTWPGGICKCECD